MKAIVCYDKKTKGIGKDGNTLFSIKKDMEYFQTITDGKMVVMGNTTYNSLAYRPLPNRVNIVITKFPEQYSNSTAETNGTLYMNLPSFLKMIENMKNTDNIYVIGGGEIYKLLLPYCNEVYATEVYSDKDLEPDTFFPSLPKKEWNKDVNMYLCNYFGSSVFITLYRRRFCKCLSIPRKTYVGRLNANKIKYDVESYRKAYNDFIERCKYYGNNESYGLNMPCEILYGNDPYTDWTKERFIIIDPINSHGVTLSVVEDTNCTLEFTDEELYNKVKQAKEENRAAILMRYDAYLKKINNSDNQLAIINRIFAFDLILGGDTCYYDERIDAK